MPGKMFMDASEYYYYYKDKYNRAVSDRSASYKKEESYISQRNQKRSQLNRCNADKSAADKRLKDVDNIIKMLEGKSGWFGTNVPDKINDAQKAVGNVDAGFRKSIRLIDGGSVDLKEAFPIKTVAGNSNSNAALIRLRQESSNLRQRIKDLNQSISSLNTAITQLNRDIRACDSRQTSLTKDINNYLYQMNYWKRRM